MYMVEAELATLFDPRFIVRLSFESKAEDEVRLRGYFENMPSFSILFSISYLFADVRIELVDASDRESVVFSRSCNQVINSDIVTPEMVQVMKSLGATYAGCKALLRECIVDILTYSGVNHYLESFNILRIDEDFTGDLDLDRMIQ